MKHNLIYFEFYITNHCNISCNNCNRFNNLKIKGSENWNEHKNRYKEWSQYITADRIAILGGEPFLHPKLYSILDDVRSWYPAAEIEITTNGLLISHTKPNLIKSIIDNNIIVYISIHKKDWCEKIKQDVVDKFGNYQLIKTRSTQYERDGADTVITSSGVTVEFEYTYFFRESALKETENNQYQLHKSNPRAAHEVCDMKHSHHFYKGKLYKCGLMVTLPELFQQKPDLINITQEQKQLLDQYKPIDLEDYLRDNNILKTLKNRIDQCEFCPDWYSDDRKPCFED